jgi:hypothetical protein
MVPCTEGYTYDVGVLAMSIVEDLFSVAPNLRVTIHSFFIAVRPLEDPHRRLSASETGSVQR